MARFIALLLALVALTLPALADDSHHPDELSEQQLGTVHFPISCAPDVQKRFEQGVALLHSFAFETAEHVFRKVAQDDPRCAMAHWGIARSFWRWDTPEPVIRKQGWSEVKVATSLHAQTKREREYISAVSALYKRPEKKDQKRWGKYLNRMEQLHRDYPRDHEVTAFYAFALIGADRDDDAKHAKRRQAAALLEPLFAVEPNHPGVAHYLIHAYDKPELAELGLPAARRYAQIASGAPHALHMPSHIFAQLGLWDEDINSNLASVAASRNASVTHMGDEGHQFHAMEFLMYAYLQSGRESDAQHLIEEVKSLPKMKSMYGIEADPQVFALLSYCASFLLELHDWDKASDLPLTPGTEFGDDSITYLVRAIGAARRGHAEQARHNVGEIDDIYNQVVARKLPFADWLDRQRKEAKAWADHAEGKNDEAIGLVRPIADKEKPGVFAAMGDLPAREMLADMLLEMNRPEQALVEYEAELKVSPNRFNSLYGAGRAAEITGQPGKATAYYQQLLKACAGGNSRRPELAHVQGFLSTVATQN